MLEENKIYLGDWKEVLKDVPDKYFDLLLTDPPYGDPANTWKKNAKSRFGGWFDKYHIGQGKDSHWVGTGQSGRLKKYHLGEKQKEELKHWDIAPTEEEFNEMSRISKNQIIWGGNYFCLPPTRCFLVWDKLTIRESFSMAMCEYAWTSFNANAKRFEIAPQDTSRFHPTQKPLELIEWCVRLFSKENDLILDCYSGSGTTAIACSELKRRFVCVEKDEFYYKKSIERLEKYRDQLQLF